MSAGPGNSTLQFQSPEAPEALPGVHDIAVTASETELVNSTDYNTNSNIPG